MKQAGDPAGCQEVQMIQVLSLVSEIMEISIQLQEKKQGSLTYSLMPKKKEQTGHTPGERHLWLWSPI